MEISGQLIPDPITIKEGETIHTENSQKYTREYIDIISDVTGLKIQEVYTDQNQWFSLVHFIC
jgi:L-histidine N-alpha-methyltransferase